MQMPLASDGQYGLTLVLKDTAPGNTIDWMLRKWFVVRKPTRDLFINKKANILTYNRKYFFS